MLHLFSFRGVGGVPQLLGSNGATGGLIFMGRKNYDRDAPLTAKDVRNIFSLSVVNGADNRQDLLPTQSGWEWPKDTWLQNRLKLKREGIDEIQRERKD